MESALLHESQGMRTGRQSERNERNQALSLPLVSVSHFWLSHQNAARDVLKPTLETRPLTAALQQERGWLRARCWGAGGVHPEPPVLYVALEIIPLVAGQSRDVGRWPCSITSVLGSREHQLPPWAAPACHCAPVLHSCVPADGRAPSCNAPAHVLSSNIPGLRCHKCFQSEVFKKLVFSDSRTVMCASFLHYCICISSFFFFFFFSLSVFNFHVWESVGGFRLNAFHYAGNCPLLANSLLSSSSC